MTTTAYIQTARPSSSRQPRSAERPARPSDESAIVGGLVDVLLASPYGIPSVIFLGGWVLLGLMLTGPFLLLVTFALVAVALVIVTAAILAPPYLLLLLVRDLRGSSARRPSRHPLRHRRRGHGPIGVSLNRPQIGIHTRTKLTSERT